MARWRHYLVGLFTTVGLAATASPTLAHHQAHYGVVPRHETVSRSAPRHFVEVRHRFHRVALAHGFRGSVICAATGHMPGSLHHTGHACDFAQTRRNRTVSLMYHAGAMIAAHGLRDGCTFGDCGHVDTGTPIRTARREAVVASLPPEPRPSRLMQRESWALSPGRGARSGIASWYRAGGMTAASRTLRMGSMARVTRDDGSSIVVRIADRGPFVRGRIIDLSRAAARALHIGGLAHVRVDPL
jgi:hypothetical protein